VRVRWIPPGQCLEQFPVTSNASDWQVRVSSTITVIRDMQLSASPLAFLTDPKRVADKKASQLGFDRSPVVE